MRTLNDAHNITKTRHFHIKCIIIFIHFFFFSFLFYVFSWMVCWCVFLSSFFILFLKSFVLLVNEITKNIIYNVYGVGCVESIILYDFGGISLLWMTNWCTRTRHFHCKIAWIGQRYVGWTEYERHRLWFLLDGLT